MRPRAFGIALAALAGLAILNALRGLNEPDEARYAVIALQMSEGGSWWLPRMSGLVHVDKPPLVYWLTALAASALGRHEWVLRLPSLLGAALALWGVWSISRCRAGTDVARWSVVVCAGALQFWVMSTVLSPDMLMTGFTTAAAGAWAQARETTGRAALLWWGAAGVAWIAAWWTKATPALLMLGVLTMALLVIQDRQGLRALRPLRTAALVLIAGLPWYVDLMLRYPELREFFLERELMGRVVGHPDGREGPPYYYLVIALAAWLPWWPMVIPRLAAAWRSAALEVAVVGLGLLAFSLISSKLPSYLLPLLPWGALAIGRMLAASCPPQGTASGRTATAGIVASLVLAFAVCLALRVGERTLGSQSSMREIGAALRALDARLVISDHYRPGLEVYFGPQVFYLADRPRRQLRSDDGVVPELGRSRFVSTSELSSGRWPEAGPGQWVVCRADRETGAVAELVRRRGTLRALRVGDFRLAELR